MIKVNSLSKIYETKSGKVAALNDVSFELLEKGFIFLLGKSGCGKSTLLNLIGGLDKPTNGEIQINGKNLDKFSAKEVDDYRNRHVGFIFQEYNLIDEYNVYENVAITLNLRGEKGVKEKVDKALETVELKGYEKRKTSELSGGQKQRIAMARAIIGDVDIVLADEPTGNLDSATSIEIFEILKDISKDKLVIAVTHDRENAERYADRIIMLADGAIISDKMNEASIEYQTIGEKQFNARPESVKENAIHESLSKDNNAYDMGGKTKRIEKNSHSKGINVASLTKLSFINIWKKKIRLIVTVILFFFMLTLFGVGVSALRYDKVTVALETFYKSEVNEFKAGFYTEENPYERVFEDEKVDELMQKFPEYKFNKMMTTGTNILIETPEKDDDYLMDNLAAINDDVMAQYGFTSVWGRLPKSFNEVCLSKYVADEMIDKKLFTEISSYADFVGFNLLTNEFPDISFEVVGVIDTKIDKIFGKMTGVKHKEWPTRKELTGSFSLSLMVDDSFMELVLYNSYRAEIEYSYVKYHPILPPEFQEPRLEEIRTGVRSESYGKLMHEKYGEIVYANGKNSLLDDEIIVSEYIMSNLAREIFPDVHMNGGIEYSQILEYLNSGLGVIRNAKFVIGEDRANYKVAGFYRGQVNYDILVNDNVIRKANPHAAIVSVNTTLKGDKKQDLRLMAELMQSPYELNSYCVPDIEGANANAEMFKKFGLYASLAFGVFAIIMMANFIVTSINSNKKQIGVLRALGMRTSGVAYIFLLEALIVGLLAFLISVIAVFPVGMLLSSFVVTYVAPVQMIVISAVEIFAMFALSIVIVSLSSVIPIIKKSHTETIKLLK